jgi:hypothetical protein
MRTIRLFHTIGTIAVTEHRHAIWMLRGKPMDFARNARRFDSVSKQMTSFGPGGRAVYAL